MDQRIINLYDQFTHGGMNRRDFLDRLAGREWQQWPDACSWPPRERGSR
jgi:hypothetical protein